MKDELSQDVVRVIKIGKQALFELIYETLIERQEEDFKVSSLEVINTFEMDWERGEFIFCVHKAEDENENIIPFPKEIDLKELIKHLPNTTHSMYASKCYCEYKKEELLEISKGKVQDKNNDSI